MASVITDAERTQVDAANSSGKQPVVFVHGLWLLASSWDPWKQLFEEAGYAGVAASWPDDPATVDEARAHPEVIAGKSIGQVADHVADVVSTLTKKPALIGHSFGGLMVQIVAGRGLAAATVAVDPAPIRGVLPLPFAALKVASVALRNPLNRGKAVPLTFEQWQYGFGNEIPEDEARQLYEKDAVAAPGKPLFQAAAANLNPFTDAKGNVKNPDRGPMLVISGEKDHAVPHAMAYGGYKQQRKNPGVTEFHEFPGRGHSLVLDHGWREVADYSLAFIQRFVPA